MINALIKVEKLKADDTFFNETGIEEEDVEPSIKRLNLEVDPEYIAIVEDYANQSKKFLEEKKIESEKFMEKVKEMKAAAEAQEAAKSTPNPILDSGLDAALI